LCSPNQVVVVDQSLAVITSDPTSNISLSSIHVASGEETLQQANVTVVSGIASFQDVTVTRAGMARLRFTLGGSGEGSGGLVATSAAFEVLPEP